MVWITSTTKRALTAAQNEASSTSGESPPPTPRACFGRAGLTDRIVGLAGNIKPIALLGSGGIGKTTIALKVLHHDRIKQRFGEDRRFIRCDQFPSSYTHLLSRLSKVIGADIENPEDLAFLRPFLSARDMLIVLDNAESILDPEGTDAKKIYGVVEELSQFDNICLCITSRISTVPSDCETIDVPTLSIDAARETFYWIYKSVGRSDLVDTILDQLDYHPLSITLLATVGHKNKWEMERLTREWQQQRTRVLQTMHNQSLATTIELSLASPVFQELGPDARALLEVVAFFPQGVNENNLDWLFPTISNGEKIFDELCALSLTCRNDSFVTMLAPLRDHLRPKDPKSSLLLCAAKEQYFTRMSFNIDPDGPGFEESRWIVSEDVNVEHLLDVFTTIDADSDGVWDACANFISHLLWHVKRFTILGPKIEALSDEHHSKPKCLLWLSSLFRLLGNVTERKRLLTHTLTLERKEGDDSAIARTLRLLSEANHYMGLYEEGIKQVEEASEIDKRLGDALEEARCLKILALLLESTRQLDAAEAAASRAVNLFSEKGNLFGASDSHLVLGHILQSKGETERAIRHFEVVPEIASFFNWDDHVPCLAHFALARLFLEEGRFDDAQVHVECAKSRTGNHTYNLGFSMALQAEVWFEQYRLEEAKAEALRAVDVFEKLGAAGDLRGCRGLLRQIEEEMNTPVTPSQSDDDGEPPRLERWHFSPSLTLHVARVGHRI